MSKRDAYSTFDKILEIVRTWYQFLFQIPLFQHSIIPFHRPDWGSPKLSFCDFLMKLVS